MEEYIKLLDLPDEFDFAILKKAYRRKVKMYHPDKAVDEAQRIGFEAAMKKLNEANERLKEYLEQHDGKYIKPVEEENITEDYSAADNDNESYHEEESNEECEEETENSDNSENSNTWTPAPEQVENSRNLKGWLINLLILFLAVSCLGKCTSDNKHPKEKLAQETKQEQQETSQTSEDNTGDIKPYMMELQRRIKTNWDLPDNVLAERGYNNVKVVVKFTVSKDGRLVGKPEIVQSSGLDIADKKCLEAVEVSAPFRPLPTFIKKDSVDMEFTFEAKQRINEAPSIIDYYRL